MRFLKTAFYNTPSDCDWLRSTALKQIECPPFMSFELHGNEDAPAKVDLYANFRPNHDEKPTAVYAMDNESGDLARQP